MSNRLTFSLASLIVLIAFGLIATPAMAAKFADNAQDVIADIIVVQGQEIDYTFPAATNTETQPDPADANQALMAATLTPTTGEISPSAVDPPVAQASGVLQGLVFTFDSATGVGKLKGNANPGVVGLEIVTYTVTETDGADADSDAATPATLTFAFQVEEQTDLLTFGDADIEDKELTQGTYFYEILPAAMDGVGPLTYSIDGVTAETPANSGIFTGGNLPAGLSFVPATRVLSGTPNAAANRVVLKYMATDSTATAVTKSISFTILVKARVNGPVFTITKVPDAAYTKGHAIEAMTLPMADETNALGSVTYAVTGLPKGLAFDATTRMLAGTPIPDAVGVSNATYIATDQSENKVSVPFKITVNDVVSVEITDPNTYMGDDAYTRGEAALMTITVAAADGTGKKTLAVADLPAGLMFDATKGEITGTPTMAGATEITATATDSLGAMGSVKHTITVKAAATLTFDAVVVPQTYTVGTAITPMLLPKGEGGIGPYTYALDGLPAGIMFDPTTRLLSGTPTTATAVADYNYMITDSAFSHIETPTADQMPSTITLPINITVEVSEEQVNRSPSFGDKAIDNVVATVGTAISGQFLPEATDPDSGDTLTYSITETLPAGLMFNATTRALTGTPTAAMAEAAYTYMVSDGNGGSDSIGFFITVNAAVAPPPKPPVTNMPPAFLPNAKIDNIVATVGVAIDGQFLPAATDPEGDRVAYWATPTLPAGLTLNSSTRALTGTPTAAMAQTAYTYNAADAGNLTNPAKLNFFITVNPEPNVAPVYADSTPIAITGTVGAAIAPVSAAATDANGDTLAYSWDVDETALGLMLDTATGIISGTPKKVHTGSHPVKAMDPDGLYAMRNVTVTISAAPPANVAPVVMITTPPTAAQTGTVAISFTVTDANAGDTVSVEITDTISPADATGYTVTPTVNDDNTAGTVLIAQAVGSPIAVISITVAATDAGGLTDTESVSVTFAARATPTPDTTPPTVAITVAPAPTGPNVHADTLRITLTFSEPVQPDTIEIGRAATDVPVLQISDPMKVGTTGNVYTVDVISEGYKARASTSVLLKRGVKDLAGNATTRDYVGAYTSPAIEAPVVSITAGPDPINCETGSTITFAITNTTEKLVAADITVSAGWRVGTDNNPADGTISIVPDGNNAIGVTTVAISVAKDAVKNAGIPAAGNAAVKATFTVGPVLTIPAGGYITVLRPEHANSTHLRDPLYLGHTGVRAPMVDIQSWACMPDLTVFFGRSAPAIGGGAITVKEADGPKGHDPGNTKADIAKGSVGISEVMWASDEGIAHGGIAVGGRSNIDQTREQWVELHNRNTSAVKVTLFARATNDALTVETDEIDRLSNYNINNVWEVKGQSGNSEFGTDFVSMQRGTPNKPEGYAHGDFRGTNGGKWSASTLPYLTRRAGLAHTGQLAAENLNFNFVGTPGRSNAPAVSTPILRTNVSKGSIVFNEIANRRDQTLEWIELKNVSTSEVNLKKYQISLATGKDADVALYNFPDNDNIKLAAGEILLLLDTDPRDNDAHPIAVAFNRDGGNDQALGIGPDAIKYKVANFRDNGLPDDGNFVLYLRNRNDRLKSHEGVIDVIGWSDKLADASIHTKVWPMKVFGTPDGRNKIEVERVHRRQHLKDPDQYTHGDKKDDHVALRDVGYTGIGYKRHAQNVAAHGGTPGYEDNRKNLVADVTAGAGVLTISEIMYDQGDGDFAQWIEIYNSSDVPVNLHSEAGWRLVIENFDDGEIPVNRLSGTLNFKNSEVQTILPQQTVLVSSTRARRSGSAFFDTRVIFPATRVFSVWDDARGEFDMKRSSNPILSEEGFYIELIDGKGNFSDGVGNLVPSPNRRVAHDKVWELSDVIGDMDGIGRSSILRRYREYKNGRLVGAYSAAQVEAMGVEPAGWIAAHKTDFLDVRQTWYGDEDDYGSPGITGGRVLPVSLSKFRPERLEDGTIVVRWITESELNNAGFNILRSDTKDGEFTQLNTNLIAGHGTTSERNAYTYTDTSAKPNVVYYYQIQDVSLDGKVQTLRMSRLKGHISAAGKATTTWGELKALQ